VSPSARLSRDEAIHGSKGVAAVYQRWGNGVRAAVAAQRATALTPATPGTLEIAVLSGKSTWRQGDSASVMSERLLHAYTILPKQLAVSCSFRTRSYQPRRTPRCNDDRVQQYDRTPDSRATWRSSLDGRSQSNPVTPNRRFVGQRSNCGARSCGPGEANRASIGACGATDNHVIAASLVAVALTALSARSHRQSTGLRPWNISPGQVEYCGPSCAVVAGLMSSAGTENRGHNRLAQLQQNHPADQYCTSSASSGPGQFPGDDPVGLVRVLAVHCQPERWLPVRPG
jgi:hypothetical protein